MSRTAGNNRYTDVVSRSLRENEWIGCKVKSQSSIRGRETNCPKSEYVFQSLRRQVGTRIAPTSNRNHSGKCRHLEERKASKDRAGWSCKQVHRADFSYRSCKAAEQHILGYPDTHTKEKRQARVLHLRHDGFLKRLPHQKVVHPNHIILSFSCHHS